MTTRREALALNGAALAIVCAVPAYELGVYLPAFNSPRVALEGVAPRRSAVGSTPGLVRRLGVMLVDGISFDAFDALGELAVLRHEGVLRGLSVSFPSFTSPAITSFVTGVEPRESGVRLNGDIDELLHLDG